MKFLTPTIHHATKDISTFSFHHWISDYKSGVDQATALHDMLEDEAHDPEMLWNYIEKRYNEGTGAFSHEEL